MIADPLIDQTVGVYRIDSRIGAGGVGTVYLAEHAVLQQRRAFKVVNPLFLSPGDARIRFLREARLPASLNHPSVLPLFDG
jgi:eukaryotic-like serine/threonine-protein kinase